MFTTKLIRLIDIIFSIIIIIFIFPLFISISLLNLLFQGNPIFFISKRVGKNGIIFNIIKFRTYVEINNEKKISNIGKYLRRLSLDEIPQVLNILIGDMSFVGPRPIPLEIENIFKNYEIQIRRSLKPGITGLSQINYIGEKRTWNEKLLLDIKMINNFSINLYFYILFKTPMVLIRRFRYNKSGDTL